jgi:hypothetical protein
MVWMLHLNDTFAGMGSVAIEFIDIRYSDVKITMRFILLALGIIQIP